MGKSKRKKKGRQLWTKIRARIPGGIDRAAFWGTLRASINRGDYELPDDWDVTIQWRNRDDAPMRSADFSIAMQESAESSRGWDKAILSYVNRQIDRLTESEGSAQKTAALTRRLVFERRSLAARNGWVTRRRHQAQRSASALKGWATRRARA